MKNKLVSFAFACAFTISTLSLAAPPNEDSGLGINVTGLSYWTSQWNLIDVMKQASDGSGNLWATSSWNNFNTREYDRLDLDPQGWPRSLPVPGDDVDYQYLTSIIYLDNAHHPHGDFVVLYDGEGTLRYSGGNFIAEQSEPGRHIVNVAEGSHFFLHIDATDPSGNGNYLRNIRIIVPGGTCDGNPLHYAESAAECSDAFVPFEETYQEQPIHPRLLQDLQNFRALRFMQYLNTITNPITDWQDRTQLEDASWALKGAPFELALQMSNAVHAEPWINIPARANDEYVRELARLIRADLAPHLRVHIELANEIWNSAWPYILDAQYMQEQGRATWPEAGVSDFEYRLNYYGHRVNQVCGLIKAEFAEEADRVNCVMGAQGGNAWVGQQSLACPVAALYTGQNCAANVDSLAIGPYFGGYFANDRYLQIMSDWASQGSSGLDNLFNEFVEGVLYGLTYDPDLPDWAQAPEHGALAAAESQMHQNKDMADQYGLELVAYEGGQHLTFAGNLSGDRTAVNDMFLDANRDPRMAQAFVDHFDSWRNAGGGLYIVFESIESWGAYGAFPLKEYQLQSDNEAVKFAAVKDYSLNVPCWWSQCERDIDNEVPPSDGDAGGDDGGGNNDTPPEDPTPVSLNASATAVPASWGIRLEWQITGTADHFKIYRDEILIGWRTALQLSFNDDWLSLGQLYEYRIDALDSAGTVIASATPAPLMAGDSEPPTEATELTLESDGAWGYELAWSEATDNTGVAYYKIYRNGEPYTHTSDTLFHDPWPPAGEIVYEVIAVDGYHNRAPAIQVSNY